MTWRYITIKIMMWITYNTYYHKIISKSTCFFLSKYKRTSNFYSGFLCIWCTAHNEWKRHIWRSPILGSQNFPNMGGLLENSHGGFRTSNWLWKQHMIFQIQIPHFIFSLFDFSSIYNHISNLKRWSEHVALYVYGMLYRGHICIQISRWCER